jgi:hypothetical protein
LRFTSANDAPERDPTSFVLSGSRDGNTFIEIARGSIPNFTARFFTVEVHFTNTAAYLSYRLIFPTVRNASSAVAVQISEVQFLGFHRRAAAGFPRADPHRCRRTDVRTANVGLSARAIHGSARAASGIARVVGAL